MGDWQVQDAKARFSELLNSTPKKAPQIVTRRGAPVEEWRRLQAVSRPSLKTLLVESGPRLRVPVPVRGKLRRWRPVQFS